MNIYLRNIQRVSVRSSSVNRLPGVAFLSSRRGGGGRSGTVRRKPPVAIVSVEEAWTEVKDNASGLSYWWNTQTNETTHLGAPKPVGAIAIPPPAPQGALGQPVAQGGGMLSGLGGVMAQGMAFGTGSAIAHHAVGSLFGGGGGSHGNDDGGGDDDFVDV